MPLKKTIYGGECPLGKFEVDFAAGGGCYTNDPVEQCLDCNFYEKVSSKDFDLDKNCQCPSDMNMGEYSILKERYISSKTSHLSKKGFLKFVQENYPLKR